jgi:uncharacterized MAPEG superfamily protein
MHVFPSLPMLLAATILLGLFQILLAGALATRIRGTAWNIGNRDGDAPPLGPVAGRADRASRNFLETFPFFAAALVCAIAMHREGHLAVVGAHLYFWARVVYLPVYLVGIPGLRSLLWIAGTVGLVMVVTVLF